MKKRYGAAGAIAFVLAGIFSCQAARESKNVQEVTQLRVGISLYQGQDTFINTVLASIEEEAKEYERREGIRLILDVADAKDDQNTQNSQTERFLSLGCDVLCINMVDRTAASGIINKAMEAGVPVVFFNREPVEEDMNRWENLYYVGADPRKEAECQGQILVDAYNRNTALLDLNGDGEVGYVLLEGEGSHQDALIRTEWAIQTLKQNAVPLKKLAGGVANWDRSQAAALTEQWLLQYPNQIELIISNNDDMALGALDVLGMQERGRRVAVAGIDGVPEGMKAVEEGKMMGTVSIDKEQYGKAVVEIATAAALKKPIPKAFALENGKYYRCPSKAYTQIKEN